MPIAEVRAPLVSRVAGGVLAILILASPWPFGSVLPVTTQAIVVVGLLTAGTVLASDRSSGRRADPRLVWILTALLGLALFQLLPLPHGVHRAIAPGSAAVWCPNEASAADVLGSTLHPISVHPLRTVRWFLFAFALGSLTFVAASAFRHRRTALRAAIAMVSGGLAVALYGLVARLSLGNRVFGVFSVPTVAPFGPFVSKNHFAGYVEGLALLALGLAVGLADRARREGDALAWASAGRGSRVVWAGAAAAVLALAVAVSLSRGGILALGAGAASFVALRWAVRRSRRAARGLAPAVALLALTAIAGFLLLPPQAQDRIRGIGSAGEEVSGSYRLGLWRDTVRLIASSPLLGHGFGAYEDALPRFKTVGGELRVEHAENDWLEVGAEGGGVALLLAIALVGLGVGQVVRGLRGQKDRLLRGMGLGAAAGALALVAHSLVDFNLRIPSNALVFAGLVALALGASRGSELVETPSTTRSARRVARIAALGIALVVSLLVPWTSDPPGALEVPGSAARPESRLRRAQLERQLVQHLRERPADAPAWARLAWVRRADDPKAARELAAHALWLDPARPGFAQALEPLAQASSD